MTILKKEQRLQAGKPRYTEIFDGMMDTGFLAQAAGAAAEGIEDDLETVLLLLYCQCLLRTEAGTDAAAFAGGGDHGNNPAKGRLLLPVGQKGF